MPLRATLFFHAKSCEIRAISCEFSEIRTNSCHSKFVPHVNSCHANFTSHVSRHASRFFMPEAFFSCGFMPFWGKKIMFVMLIFYKFHVCHATIFLISCCHANFFWNFINHVFFPEFLFVVPFSYQILCYGASGFFPNTKSHWVGVTRKKNLDNRKRVVRGTKFPPPWKAPLPWKVIFRIFWNPVIMYDKNDLKCVSKKFKMNDFSKIFLIFCVRQILWNVSDETS